MYDYDDDDDNVDYVEEDKNKKVVVPVILSQPKHIEAISGQNIILPCTVDKLSGNSEKKCFPTYFFLQFSDVCR